MDARPLRPSRSLRPINNNDENMAVHLRNKSTGQLPGATMRGGAKRAALGDVVNAKNAQNGKENDASVLLNVVKKGVANDGKKAASLSRAAQRPLNGGTHKGGSVVANASNNPEPVNHAFKAATIKKGKLRLGNGSKRPAIGAVFQDSTSSEGQSPEEPTEPAALPAAPRKSESIREHYKSLVLSHMNGEATDNSAADETYEESVQALTNEELSDLEEQRDFDAFDNIKGPRRTKPIEAQGAQAATTVSAIDNTESELAMGGSISSVLQGDITWPQGSDDTQDGYTTAQSYRSKGEATTGSQSLGSQSLAMYSQVAKAFKRELALAKIAVETSLDPEDAEDEAWDPTMVAEYGEDIFQYMRELELKMLPDEHYMDEQIELQWSMRAVLMDWLVQVHSRFNLLPETLFLCVNYVDRFLSNKIVSMNKLQLVGATALFIAAKYEEINCPSVTEIVFMVDGMYTADDILKAERFMLGHLNFELGWPGPMSFLRRISKADDYDLETRTLAKYFLEVAIMDENFVASPASMIAASAHCLSRLMLRKGEWTQHHVHYSGYCYGQIHHQMSLLCKRVARAEQHHAAIFEKYSDPKFQTAALYVQSRIHSGFKLEYTSGSGSRQPRVRGSIPDFTLSSEESELYIPAIKASPSKA